MRRSLLLAVIAVIALAGAAPASATTVFGLLDTGELYASTDGGVNWSIRSTLPVNDAVALVAGFTPSQLYLASEAGSFYRSTDAGNTWTAVSAVTASDVSALIGFNGTYLLLTASGSVYRSTDAGDSWNGVGAITAPDIVSGAHLGSAWFALARTGGVYRSLDDGATWTAIGTITTSEAVELAAYSGKLHAISASGDLYQSNDAGVSFAAVSTLSQVGTTAMVSSAGELIAALGTGETAASSNATSWTWRGAINQLEVRALATDVPTTTGVGSGGPGLLRLAAPYPNPAKSVVHLALELARESDVTMTVFDVAGREVAHLASGERLGPGPVSRDWRPERLSPGVYTVRAVVEGRSLSRRVLWLGDR